MHERIAGRFSRRGHCLRALSGDLRMAPEPGTDSLQATPLQVGIVRLEALEGRIGHHGVAHCIAHRGLAFDLAGTPQEFVEQVAGLQLGDVAVALAPSFSQESRHCRRGIADENARGHPDQEDLGGLGPGSFSCPYLDRKIPVIPAVSGIRSCPPRTSFLMARVTGFPLPVFTGTRFTAMMLNTKSPCVLAFAGAQGRAMDGVGCSRSNVIRRSARLMERTFPSRNPAPP